MTELMRDSLILARNLGMDVFNALNLMQNKEFLQVKNRRCFVCVCVCVYLLNWHITAQSGSVILVILCHSHCVCVCVH